ncbi:glycosyltransferase [Metapseudomonas otitidis]|uniref:glycosyltransferase n=1 Tax=Metapseudomonas otitidis TaxID=319939 RepID=UPI002097B07D|nr:glycosyltransferase [Pseudomonas otitidis]MCO7553312.1 glycosyltransferase [Pseudomonas otitidis]
MKVNEWPGKEKSKFMDYLQWNSFRSERHRLFYVATPKVACTTLKWWFANLEDCSQEVRAIENNPESDAELAVHHAHLVAPNLTGLSQSEISNVLDSDSYFKFAVVRNPYQRIFSAWQSKILLREPLQVGPYVDTDFYHYPIKTAADIANAFEIFLEHLAANEAPAYWDHHWTPQADLLRPDFINYTCIVKIEESETLTHKLGTWLRRYIPSPFQGRRSNESLIPYASELVTKRSAELIRILYAHDFDAFGYDKQTPEVKASFSVEQYDTAITAIKIIRARHKRLGERNELIVGLNDRLVQCEGQISNLVQAVAERDSQIVGLNDTRVEHEGQIGSLSQALIERDSQIAGLNDTRVEYEGQIASLSQALIERDSQIAGLNDTRVEYEGQIASLSQALIERDSQIFELNDTRVEHEDQIASLSQALIERDSQIVGLNDTRVEHEGQIASLSQALIERDSQIVGLNDTRVEYESVIANLNLAVAKRENHISELNNALVQNNAQLNFQSGRIKALQQSDSWRLTKPLRIFSSLFKNSIKPIRVCVSRGSIRIPLIRQRAIRQIQQSPLFDKAYYIEQNPDVAAAKVEPAAHYCLSGWREHRDPSTKFSTSDYLDIHSDVADAKINPLMHYIEFGQFEGRLIRSVEGHTFQICNVSDDHTPVKAEIPPHVISADSSQDHYEAIDHPEEEQLLITRVIDPERIDAEAEAIRKSGLFDAAYYLAMYPGIQPVPTDPIRHYCESGWHKGLNPSDNFDTNGYLNVYSDIRNAGLNPFWHYVVAGASESRQANPDSNSTYEEDVFFGKINTHLQLIAYYSDPNVSVDQKVRDTVKGNSSALVPHADIQAYAESDRLVKQALMARHHGVSGWCFSLGLEQNSKHKNTLTEFLSNKIIDIGFILDIDLRSMIVDEQFPSLLQRLLADERYMRIDGRNIVVVTLPNEDKQCHEILHTLGAILNSIEFSNPFIVGRRDGLAAQADDAAIKFKLDAILDFPLSPIPGETGDFPPLEKNGAYSVPYSVVVSQSIARMIQSRKFTVPCYQVVTLGRDEMPLGQNAPLRYTQYRQKEYRRWLDAAISETTARHQSDQRLLFINAWNDWSKGAALEPDRLWGYSKLNETTRALLGLPFGLALPKVSVIVPNYNHAKYLPRRLESIYRQTYTNIEVLLLDDCSTDNSRDVLLDYANRYPLITRALFNQENSGGVFRQWAKGIKAATGDLIWIAESDDYCDVNFLEKLVRCFDDEAVMLAYSKIEFVNFDESRIDNEFRHYVWDLNRRDKWDSSYVNTAHREVAEALGIINTIPNASGAIFRCPVEMPLLEDEAWLSLQAVGDWIFYLYQLRGGKIAYSTETTNYFRRHQDSKIASINKKENFFRELAIAQQTVQKLYNVPVSIIEQSLAKFRLWYNIQVGGTFRDFDNLCSERKVLEARCSRVPNVMVSTMGFYPGGAEILPIRMANEFKRQGYSVTLLSGGHGSCEVGVRRMLRRDIPVVETGDINATKKLISEFGIDVLNTHQWHMQKYPDTVPDVYNDLKVHVASLHGMIEYGDAFGVTAEQLRIADKSVTTWVYTADKNLGPFIEHGLYDEKMPKFIKLPNGMEPPLINPVLREEIGFPDDAFVLCCVSRAIPEKGWAEAIEAVAKARDITRKDIRLILVGNGPVYDDYCLSGVPSFVYLAGFSENSVGFYAASDMGIMLTRFKSESFPLTIVDCLFAGKPYIATSVGEIKNMLTTPNGLAGATIELEDWVVPIDEAAQVISNFVMDTEAFSSAEKLVAEAADRYRIDIVAKQYAEIFDKSCFPKSSA